MAKPIHILHMIDGLELGGAEGLVFDLTSRLLTKNFRVSVGYCEAGTLVNELNKLGISTTKFPWHSRVDLSLIRHMYDFIKRDPPQIVHTHLFKCDFHGRLAARLAGVPVVLSTLHNCDVWAKNPVLGSTYGATAFLADKLIAVADEVRDYAMQYFHIPGNRIVTIKNAIQIDRYEQSESLGRAFRKEFDIESDAILFGIIARLDPQKDHENFLNAAVIIKNTVPNARFIVVGDGRLRDTLIKLTLDLGLERHVIFCGMRKDIQAVLSALDVMVLSSQYEGLPVVVLEAMAASRPVVSTAVNGVPGVVADQETGILVPPRNSQMLAEACIKLATNPSLRLKMGEAGYLRVKNNYTINAMTDNTISLYNTLLDNHGVL